MDCVLPSNPDISGIGVRVAIYVQNFLSFIPAFWALQDGKVTSKELRTVEKQATAILITAFAVLISAMVQAATFSLSSFHTSIVLDLSWMNNTNVFIYFLLYVHRMSDPKRRDKQVPPRWLAWYQHIRRMFITLHAKSGDHENHIAILSTKIRSHDGQLQGRTPWHKYLLRKKVFVLILGSMHLTLMSALGIWMWSSPYQYEARQGHRLTDSLSEPDDSLPLLCTTTTILGVGVKLVSPALPRISLVVYGAFLMPVVNLIIPAVLFLFLFINGGGIIYAANGVPEDSNINRHTVVSHHRHEDFTDRETLPAGVTSAIKYDRASMTSQSTSTSSDSTTSRPSYLISANDRVHPPRTPQVYNRARTWPVTFGLVILFLVNVVFVTDIELTLHRAQHRQDRGELDWTFGQTLALLLLVLPLRDVIEYISDNSKAEYAKKCTKDLAQAVKGGNVSAAKKAARYADNLQVPIIGTTYSSALHYAAWNGYIDLVDILLRRKKLNINVEGMAHGTPLLAAVSQRHEEVACHLLQARKGGKLNLRQRDKDGKTALHYAADYGLDSAAKLLLDRGANPNTLARDTKGWTPLHYAAAAGHDNVVKLLLSSKVNTQVQDQKNCTPLFYAERNKHGEVIKLLQDTSDRLISSTSHGLSPLSAAASKGARDLVLSLLRQGVDIDYAEEDGRTPLSFAASMGRTVIVADLLVRRARVDQAGDNGRTPLSYACGQGHVSVARILLDRGADVNAAEKDGQTPLIYASSGGYGDVMDLLIERGATSHTGDMFHRTPLSYAASQGQVAAAELLIKHGAIIDEIDILGRTPLSYAAGGGHEEVVKLLLPGDTDNTQDEHAVKTSFNHAVRRDRGPAIPKIFQKSTKLMRRDNSGRAPASPIAQEGDALPTESPLYLNSYANRADNGGDTPLIYAVRGLHVATFDALLQGGADINKADKNGRTPLSLAAGEGHDAIVQALIDRGADLNKTSFGRDWTPLFYAIRGSHAAVTRVLLNNSPNINTVDSEGRTVLSYAAEKGHELEVRILLSQPGLVINVNEPDDDGLTPLIYAARCGHLSVVHALLEYHADVNLAQKGEWSALIWSAAANYMDVVETLLRQQANANQPDAYGSTALIVAARNGHASMVGLLLQHGAMLNAGDRYGRTALSFAAGGGHNSVVQLLLVSKPDVELADNGGRTPLIHSVENNHRQAAKLLLKEGADAEKIETTQGLTALALAASHGRQALVKSLIKYGAQVNHADLNHRSPLIHAVSNGHHEVARMLLDHGADINQADQEQQTPLYHATRDGNRAVVELLLEHERHVDLTVAAADGRTALQVAIDNEYGDIVELLKGAGALPGPAVSLETNPTRER